MRVLITGVGGFAGYYVALRLAASGHDVTGLVRNPDQPRLDTLRTHEVKLAIGDVSKPDTYRELLEKSTVIIHTMLDKKQPKETDQPLFGAIAALPEQSGTRRRFIYTTGCSIFGKVGVPIMDETTEPHPAHALYFRRELEKEALETWRETFRVNLDGTMLCTKLALPHMRRQGGGAIVNMGSISGLVPYARGGAYAASKAAIATLTKVTALEAGPFGVRVNCICAGSIQLDTPGGDDDRLPVHTPIGRLGRPDDVAQLVSYLASDAASYLTGASSSSTAAQRRDGHARRGHHPLPQLITPLSEEV